MREIHKQEKIALTLTAIAFAIVLIFLPLTFGTILNASATHGNGYGYGYGCTPHTPGYWKNHPDAWPVEEITIGGITYSKADAIMYMEAPTARDKTYNMFEHLVAAKLNVLNGCIYSCVEDTILDADAWMEDHPVGSGVTANSPAWQDEGKYLHSTLDNYNNGKLC